ncbi:hypothetical protein Pla163_06600 [Planctomycetes bacterium Pla163]|uniref:Uncharacterized protein n=1 Tax=Rohdeia mirabilis TaxID=2528008 RepID=A0A518CWF1_9BACT|nr:hypothetical protein Pla163_06600 [Planctomycetes bacterium Pla163]
MTKLCTASALVLSLLVAACSWIAPAPAPPGYSGPIASPAARDLLADLVGATFEDTSGALGGGTITVGPFGVVPNPLTGKGPVVQVEGAAGTRYLPMLTDGDVADLWARVDGSPPAGFDLATSDAYRAVWGEAGG